MNHDLTQALTFEELRQRWKKRGRDGVVRPLPPATARRYAAKLGRIKLGGLRFPLAEVERFERENFLAR